MDDDLQPIQPFVLSDSQMKTASDLAALWYSPKAIAAALGLEGRDAEYFISAAKIPGSAVYDLLQRGERDASAIDLSLLKLAKKGDTDAVEALRKARARNLYDQVIAAMDEDEFSFSF